MRQYRTPVVLALLAAATTVIVTLVAGQIALQQVTAAGYTPDQMTAVQEQLRDQFAALAIIGSLAVLAVVWLVGHLLDRPHDRLRLELATGRIVDPVAESYTSWANAHTNALRLAALRLTAEHMRQARTLERVSADRSALLDAISEGLIHIDREGRVIQANPAAIGLLGLPGDAAGKVLASLVRNVELRQAIAAAAAGNAVEGAEVAVDDRRLLLNAAPIPSSGQALPSAVVSITDLTQLRRLEGVRREFVANVSHELKTPLTSIHGYTETLRADDDLPIEMRHQFLDVIKRNAVRLQHIVDELLDLARIESGVWVPETQRVDVTEIAMDAWQSSHEHAAARDVTFAAPDTPVFVLADPTALRQVFVNLFDNAVRYTGGSGSIAVKATVEPPAEGGDGVTYIRIDVADNGAGIPRDALPRIFERFYRVDPARSRAAGGTGLGLAIVKHAIEGMGGEVSAESELGIGTTIILRLPAA